MTRKTYKQKYLELKKSLEVDTKIAKHTKSYIHIPFSWGAIGRFFALLGSIGLAIANFFLMISVGHTYKVWQLLVVEEPTQVYHSFKQLIILYPIIGQYLLVGLVLICLTALIKGGFKRIKKWEEAGLIAGLISGLIAGLIAGLIFWLIFWLISGLISGLIAGLIVGLIAGLISGLISGLKEEFDERF